VDGKYTFEMFWEDLDNGYILDGFPRNLNQAIEYDKILKELNRDLGVVIYLDTPRDILEKRITGRRLCEDCGSTYNVLTGVNTPKTDGKCDKCGGNLYQRSDDNSESFMVRYQEFIDKTYPLVEYYKKNNALVSIDSVDPEDTIKAIEGVIND